MSRPVPSVQVSTLKQVLGLAVMALLLAGCGRGPSEFASAPTMSPSVTASAPAAPSPSAVPSPATPTVPPVTTTPSSAPPRAGLLFAVVEGAPPGASQPGTVAIVGMDGYARAKATFQPRTGPVIPDAYTPLQGVAQVVGSGVYYIDAAGTVRVLRVGSQPQVVARFPLQPAQEDVWFAVSPDGSHVLAGILTLPALGPLVPGTNWPTFVGPWKFDLESAPAGGQSKTLVHFESTYSPDDPNKGWTPTFPVGWTSAGPIAMRPVIVTSQNAWTGGPLYVIDDSGKNTRQLGGSNCDSASIASSGLIPCISGNAVTVRDSTGKVLWSSQLGAFSAVSLFVSPDGQAISDGSQVDRRVGGLVAGLQRPSGPAGGFLIQGWLDNNTVVGRIVIDDANVGNLGWISLSNPGTVHDLGFKGDFVATLT